MTFVMKSYFLNIQRTLRYLEWLSQIKINSQYQATPDFIKLLMALAKPQSWIRPSMVHIKRTLNRLGLANNLSLTSIGKDMIDQLGISKVKIKEHPYQRVRSRIKQDLRIFSKFSTSTKAKVIFGLVCLLIMLSCMIMTVITAANNNPNTILWGVSILPEEVAGLLCSTLPFRNYKHMYGLTQMNSETYQGLNTPLTRIVFFKFLIQHHLIVDHIDNLGYTDLKQINQAFNRDDNYEYNN